MKSVSTRKLSILGLVLMTASAVTAAIIPSKGKKDTNDRAVGALVISTNNTGGNTCLAAGNGLQCDFTATGNGVNASSTSATNVNPAQPNDDHSDTAKAGSATGTETTIYG